LIKTHPKKASDQTRLMRNPWGNEPCDGSTQST